MIDNNTSLENLLKVVKDTLQELKEEEEFIVRDLFRGFEWNRIAKGNRTKLGALVFSYANHEGATIIKPLGKTPQNQQRYKKI